MDVEHQLISEEGDSLYKCFKEKKILCRGSLGSNAADVHISVFHVCATALRAQCILGKHTNG